MPVAAPTARQVLRDHGKLQAGQKILVNGVDYTHDDFTRRGLRYDLLPDNAGSRSLSAYRA